MHVQMYHSRLVELYLQHKCITCLDLQVKTLLTTTAVQMFARS